ncbi:MAG: hypothetical protein ACTHLW_15900 [Verrucomicrobiota bacterium]
MLLEEAVLHLLQRSGYRTVDAPGTDPTLCNVGAGLAVRGRGSEHQIDAIADFVVHQPFSNPQRLLVESKCYGSNYRVGIEVVRNAIGVLKDTSEFWVVGPGPIAGRRRYHYQYAIFSASPFSSGAQRYAFAQDVHLFPLDRSRYFQPILEAIRRIVPVALVFPRPMTGGPRQFSEFRAFVREFLRSGQPRQRPAGYFQQIDVRPFINACHQLNYALVAVLGGRFPVLLTPSQVARERRLQEQMHVRIYWNEEGWYLRSEGSQENLFSFDLPDELFELYAEEGFLNPQRALDLKEQMMSTFQAIETSDGHSRIINFVLDREWIAAIRRRMD